MEVAFLELNDSIIKTASVTLSIDTSTSFMINYYFNCFQFGQKIKAEFMTLVVLKIKMKEKIVLCTVRDGTHLVIVYYHFIKHLTLEIFHVKNKQ